MPVFPTTKTIGLALMLGLVAPEVAFAHAHLVSEAPAADTVVGASPPRLTLKFSEELELRFTTLSITGPDQKPVTMDAPRLDPADATMLIVPLPTALPPGRYKVVWHATATDTHRTQGHYGFTVKP